MVEDSRGHRIAKDNLIYDLYSKFNEKVPEDRADQIKTYEHEFDYQVGKNLQIIYQKRKEAAESKGSIPTPILVQKCHFY